MDRSSRNEALQRLLLELFNEPELRTFVSHGAQGDEIASRLPGGHASLAELAADVARQVRARGVVEEFFARLLESFPKREEEISGVRRIFSAARGRRSSEGPGDSREPRRQRSTRSRGAIPGAMAVVGIVIVIASLADRGLLGSFSRQPGSVGAGDGAAVLEGPAALAREAVDPGPLTGSTTEIPDEGSPAATSDAPEGPGQREAPKPPEEEPDKQRGPCPEGHKRVEGRCVPPPQRLKPVALFRGCVMNPGSSADARRIQDLAREIRRPAGSLAKLMEVRGRLKKEKEPATAAATFLAIAALDIAHEPQQTRDAELALKEARRVAGMSTSRISPDVVARCRRLLESRLQEPT